MSWPLIALKDLVDINIGRTPSRDSADYWGSGTPWLSIRDMSQGKSLLKTAEQITPQAVEDTKIGVAKKGTVLFSFKLSIGKVGIAGLDMCHNEAIASMPIKKGVEMCEEYLYFALKQLDSTKDTDRAVMGATLNKKKMAELKIPLPPLEIQKKIAAVLEKADQLRKDCQQMEQELNSLAQSVFIDMFGDPVTNPKGWDKKELLSLCSKVTDGTHQSPEWAETGVPFLFISNVRNGKVDFDTGKYITRRCYEELTRTSPIEVDDILYTTVGSYGHVALVKDNFPDFCFQRHIAHIKPDPNKVIPEFLFYQLQTSGVKHLADLAVKGIAQKTLNLKDLKKFEMIVPPEEKQFELINYMNHQYQALNELEQIKSDYEMLFNSLMQKAFKGELNL